MDNCIVLKEKIINEFGFSNIEEAKQLELFNRIDILLTKLSLDKSELIISQNNSDYKEFEMFCNGLEVNNDEIDKFIKIIDFLKIKKIDYYKIYEEEIHKLKIQFIHLEHKKNLRKNKKENLKSLLDFIVSLSTDSGIIPAVFTIPYEITKTGTDIAFSQEKDEIAYNSEHKAMLKRIKKLRLYQKIFLGLISLVFIFIIPLLLYLIPHILLITKVIDKIPNWIVKATPDFIKYICYFMFN